MAYIRPMEKDVCLYIYPEDGRVRFMCFPDHMNESFPDEMLDILLVRMSDKELLRRRQHGDFLLKVLQEDNNDLWNEKNLSINLIGGKNNGGY